MKMIRKSEIDSHHVTRHLLLPAAGELVLEDVSHVVFVIPPTRSVILRLKEIIAKKKAGINYHVRVVTRTPSQEKDMFEDKAIDNRIRSFGTWPFFWFPTLGGFLLNSFDGAKPQTLFLLEDVETLFFCSHAISALGFIPTLRHKGRWAQQVVQGLRNLKPVSSLFHSSLRH